MAPNKTSSEKPSVLIANRGEIAIRIARTAKRLGFGTVAVYSDADRFSEHVRICDQAVYIGGSEPKQSYLDAEKVVAAAKKTGARFVHPGFGFLSERPHFVEACEKAGLIFVGPTAESMRLMGDKITARNTVAQVDVSGVPGSPGAVKSAEEAAQFADQFGYPVLLKATAGGGGKGMRRVDHASDLKAAFEGASREALSAFGDGSMYLEKFILEPHHVEIQVFGDGKGGAIHLGERECSIQRRHQKVWEESPAPILNKYPKTREAMFEAALRVVRHVKYAGAGTLEFIVDGKGNFYFLEMNTRLQVEHPVTEWVTGVDLVAWQLLLAAGQWKLPEIPKRQGSSIEVRFYAEDPHHFLPAPGKLGLIQMPQGPFLRSDAAFTERGEVSRFYDPMIAKISVWGADRDEAVSRLRVALDEVRVEPPKTLEGERQGSLKTNLSFLKRLVRQSRAISGDTTTDLIAADPSLTAPESSDVSLSAAIALSLFQITAESETQSAAPAQGVGSTWLKVSREEGVLRGAGR
ncbi:MAG: ATP-grasp domain-containing protein [Bdellovibrionales bacterium]|nr:ATP-grasp domain-containing protein [Bdellovibrionales bacterium]